MSETTRVCLDAGMRYPWPACDRNADRPPILPFAGWCLLPRSAQCGRCVNFVGLGSRMVGKQPPSMSATRSHILSVSLFCAGLHGSLDATLRALLAQHIAGDGSAASIALDLAEERGYDTPGMLPVASVEWPWIEQHEHAWLPWRSGDEARAERTAWAAPVQASRLAPPTRRCTCGVFEHDQDAHARASHLR